VKTSASKVHERQQQYVQTLTDTPVGAEMIAAEAFVESIRKLGYKSAATAADEIIDNSIEAGAENVHVAFGFGPKSENKPNEIAFLDDGYGMVPGMVAAAARWGGTHRHGSRDLFGRFGFGLPSASVSQGRAFSVYSRVDDGDFYAVTVDVEGIVKGEYTKNGRVIMPAARPQGLPDWVIAYASKHFPGGVGGISTVVVWHKFDVLTWTTTTGLETNFLQHFGMVYRGFLRSTGIVVNGKKVEPIDPLFTTEGFRFFDYDEDRAEAYPSLQIELKDDAGKLVGVVKVRFAYMPPGFMSKDKSKDATLKNGNPRAAIRRENNGLIFTRHGRQIDVISRSDVYNFQNNDRYVGVEVDFPASLDDEFGITTAKQQVTLSSRMVDLLRKNNVHTALGAMRRRYEEEAGTLRAARAEGANGGPRTSETVMEEVSTIMRQKPMSEEQEKQAQENMEREIEKIAREAGLPQELVAEQKEREALVHPYKVLTERMVDGPFYRVEQRGGQLVIILNTSHRFFTDVYSTLEGVEGLRVRAALELLIFVLGQCELEATTDGRIWYQSERVDWSRKLNAVLTKLEEHMDVIAQEPEVEAP
jgi:hypothetical protein